MEQQRGEGKAFWAAETTNTKAFLGKKELVYLRNLNICMAKAQGVKVSGDEFRWVARSRRVSQSKKSGLILSMKGEEGKEGNW